MTQSIFVQIASYRDPELIPTLHNLIERAQFPENLRVVVCWQHGPDELVGKFFAQNFEQWQLRPQAPFSHHTFQYRGAQVELIDVAHELSQGACWARNLIQQQYQDEAYTLQLDSHHRFVQHWDTQLIDMMEQLRSRSPKPLLTAYLPGYTPSGPAVGTGVEVPPLGMRFERFCPEGVVFFRTYELPDWQALQSSVPARFYSGHFTFADGTFAREVRHDPDYFFHGEEISLAVRAFTHGYDLYHPHRNLAWHEYTREGRTKIWDDHSAEARDTGLVSEVWWERNKRSLARNRALFGIATDDSQSTSPHDSEYGFGNVRSLDDYEAYAGISFSERAVQPEVLERALPIPGASKKDPARWRVGMRRCNDLHVTVHRDDLDLDAYEATAQCRLEALRADGSVLYEEADSAEAARKYYHHNWFNRHLEFQSDIDDRASGYRISLLDEEAQVLAQFEKAVEN